jgi:hypothetical protein
VPHSQFSFKENPKVLQNLKITQLKIIFGENFCLMSGIVIQVWHSKKLLICFPKLYVFHKRKSPKVMSKMQVRFVNEAPVH